MVDSCATSLKTLLDTVIFYVLEILTIKVLEIQFKPHCLFYYRSIIVYYRLLWLVERARNNTDVGYMVWQEVFDNNVQVSIMEKSV